ncbi:MAG: formylglycine-generating enzyme family protein [Alphaproteobacteria bacterium]
MNDDMVLVPGSTLLMGSNDHYPEEAPTCRVSVDSFLIDRTPVTNAAFKAFIETTGYVTLAERMPDARLYPGADPALLKPGSSVFTPPAKPVALSNAFAWWSYVFGANWRHPEGPGSSVDALGDHPVVHIAHADAIAYASWCGKRLPTEAEWECAARGGADGLPYAWGMELEPKGRVFANYWRGPFPYKKLQGEPYRRTSPVGAFPANSFGLYDMIGNVWEWTQDWYSVRSTTEADEACCVPRNPRGGTEDASRDPNDPGFNFGRKVLKGGSHLCAENYCRRYRPAARYPQTIDTSTSHIGFRCAKSV